jgi:LAS superfamily LD-carboxypeptidase LdcB
VVTRAEVVSVRGILVHRSIAGQVEGLLAAASAAGVALSGSGWRDTSRQIELRQQHCGTTPYAIYEMPADQCIPPVARPGRSMHERGLAVDFVVGGDLIRTRSHPAYVWLAANASRFGLFNLPSEPWHWSTTGT